MSVYFGALYFESYRASVLRSTDVGIFVHFKLSHSCQGNIQYVDLCCFRGISLFAFELRVLLKLLRKRSLCESLLMIILNKTNNEINRLFHQPTILLIWRTSAKSNQKFIRFISR